MSFRLVLSPWVAALLLQTILSGVLLTKRLWRKFPFFVGYCVSGLVLNVSLYAVYSSQWRHQLYFKAYWFTEGLGLLMGLAVTYEIFNLLFNPYPALRKLAMQAFQGVVVLLVLVGCVVAYMQPLGENNHVQAAFMIIEQATRVLEVGLLGFLFLFASAFGLHWRQYVFGIAVGLGVFAVVELVAITMRVEFGVTASPVFNIVRTISFNTSLLIWIGYILAPELAAAPSEMPKRAQLEQWNRAVTELIYQ